MSMATAKPCCNGLNEITTYNSMLLPPLPPITSSFLFPLILHLLDLAVDLVLILVRCCLLSVACSCVVPSLSCPLPVQSCGLFFVCCGVWFGLSLSLFTPKKSAMSLLDQRSPCFACAIPLKSQDALLYSCPQALRTAARERAESVIARTAEKQSSGGARTRPVFTHRSAQTACSASSGLSKNLPTYYLH